MTLYVDRHLPAADPQTHLLLIGVNDYPHLIGGSDTPASFTYGQGQLTTPVHSALKIAQWFDSSLDNPGAPLGTIEMVLSPGRTPVPSVAPATLPEIKKAFSAWYQRCEKNPGNVAWFYFCGHGLESANNVTALLSADYGKDHLDPWGGAFDFRAMFQNVADWACNTQIFMLDACRTKIPDSLSGLSALKSATPTSFPPRDAPIFKATSVGNAALGPSNAPSYFSEALVDSLQNLSASYFNGSKWVVNTVSLAQVLLERMYRTLDGGLRRPLPCDIGGGVQTRPFTQIHAIAQADVRVMSEIVCDPTTADDDTILAAVEPTLPFQVSSRGQTRPWWPTLPIGDYELDGTLIAGSTFTSIENQPRQRVAPPKFTRQLKVHP